MRSKPLKLTRLGRLPNGGSRLHVEADGWSARVEVSATPNGYSREQIILAAFQRESGLPGRTVGGLPGGPTKAEKNRIRRAVVRWCVRNILMGEKDQ